MDEYSLDGVKFKTLEYSLDGMTFTPLSEESVSSLRIPTTYEFYNHQKDRAAVINKYNFTHEVIHSKDPQKEELIQNISKELHKESKKIDDLNDELKTLNSTLNELKAPERIKEINQHLEKVITKNNEEKKDEFGFNILDEKNLSPIFPTTISESNLEYTKSLGVSYEVNIPKEDLDLLNKSLKDGSITQEIYKQKKEKLIYAYSKIKVDDSYYDNLFKLYFEFIKPAIEVSRLDWLHESHVFYPENPKRFINDYEEAISKDRMLRSTYDRSTGQMSFMERLARVKGGIDYIPTVYESIKKKHLIFDVNKEAPETREKDLFDNYTNSKDEDFIKLEYVNPKYTYKDIINNKDFYLGEAGLGKIFPDNKLFLDHLAYEFQPNLIDKINGYFGEGYDYDENKFYLEHGYKKNDKKIVLINKLKELSINGKTLLDIDSYKDFQELNLSSQDKQKYFLNLLVACFKMDNVVDTINRNGVPYLTKEIIVNNKNGSGRIDIVPDLEYKRYFETYQKDENLSEYKYVKQKEYNTIKTKTFTKDCLIPLTKEDLNNPNFVKLNKTLKNGLEVKGGIKDPNNDGFYSVIQIGDNQKFDYYDIIKRFPYMKQLFLCDENELQKSFKNPKGFSLNEIDNEYMSKISISETYFERLWNMNINIENDFELIHSIYLDTLLQFDSDRDLDVKLKLDTIWKKNYEPWFTIEKDKEIFWEEITKNVTNNIVNSKEFELLFDSVKSFIKNQYDSFMNNYSMEARESNQFNFNLDVDYFISDIIQKYKNAILSEYDLLNLGDKKYEISYDKENYIMAKHLAPIIDKNQKQNPLRNFFDSKVSEEMYKIRQQTDVKYLQLGKQGEIFFDKILNVMTSQMLPSKINEKQMSGDVLSLYSNEIRKRGNEMQVKYSGIKNEFGSDFFNMQKPPYFPTVKKCLELDMTDPKLEGSKFYDYYLQNIKPIYDQKNELKKLNIPEYGIKDKVKYKTFEKEINDAMFIGKLIVGKDLIDNKSDLLLKVIDLEKERSVLMENHNSTVNTFVDKKNYRKELLEKYDEKTKKLRNLKIENYVVTNNVDKEKFVTTMKAIVDMTLNTVNKEKIVDLTKIDNVQDSLKYFEVMTKDMNPVTRNALTATYIAYIDDIYTSKGLTSDFHIETELNNLKKQIISFSSNSNKEDLFTFDFNDKNITGVKLYEGNHIPLFIDLESNSIWTLEWTTNYPTLNVFILNESYAFMNKQENQRDFNEYFYSHTNNIKEENMDKVYIPYREDNNFYNNLIKSGVFKGNKEITLFNYMDKLNTYNRKELDLIHLDNLDRVKDIFALIQSNYFLQLEQIEDRSLFLDVDVNYLLNSTPNMGAVSFMNNNDLYVLEKFYDKESKDFNDNKLNFINPFNYKESDFGTHRVLMTQRRKIDGYIAENDSKKLMRSVQEFVKENKEYGHFNEDSLKSYSFVYEVLYGQKYYGSKLQTYDPKVNTEDQIINIYDGNPNSIKIFSSLEELENYKRHYNYIMDKEINTNNIKTV